jgi:hypothetical protein
MLDDLRKSTEANEPDEPTYAYVETNAPPQKFLGMTAVERMFLALFFFMNVLVIGLALLLATGRLVL